MIKTHDIFVAYAGPDRGVAAELIGELHSRRVTVWWDALLNAEDSFGSAVSDMLSSCRVFTIIVSSRTWDGQHYATEELAIAIQLARVSGIAIAPVWLSPILIENRPYGIATKTGISLVDHDGCLGCVAGELVEVLLRTQLTAAVQALSSAITQQRTPELPFMVNPVFLKEW